MRNQRRSENGRDKSGKKHGHQKRDRNPGGRNQPNKFQQKDQHRETPKKTRVSKDTSTRDSGLIEIPIRLNQQQPANLNTAAQDYRPKPARLYKVVFFDNVASAKSDLSRLKDLAQSCDQLNIIVRSDVNAEITMADPELNAFGKVFAGAAWALIHERRISEGWYDQKH